MKKPYLILCLASIALGCTILIQTKIPMDAQAKKEGIGEYFKLLLERQAGPSGTVDPMDVYKVEQQIGHYNMPIEMKKLYEDKIQLLEEKIEWLQEKLSSNFSLETKC